MQRNARTATFFFWNTFNLRIRANADRIAISLLLVHFLQYRFDQNKFTTVLFRCGGNDPHFPPAQAAKQAEASDSCNDVSASVSDSQPSHGAPQSLTLQPCTDTAACCFDFVTCQAFVSCDLRKTGKRLGVSPVHIARSVDSYKMIPCVQR